MTVDTFWNGLHDATLLGVDLDWSTDQGRIHIRRWSPELSAVELVEVTAVDVREFTWTRRSPWAPSVSINDTAGPQPTLGGEQVLEIEMQSGDVLRIVAVAFEVPAAGERGA